MKIATTNFGELEVTENDLFHFPEGIPGFDESLKNFFFVDPNNQTLVLWLQSKEDAAKGLPLLEPKIFNPNYSLKLLPSELESLDLKDMSDASVYCVVTIPKENTEMTANLKAPIIINNKTRKGRQILLQDNKLEMKFPIYYELKKYVFNYTSTQEKKTMPSALPTIKTSKEKESNV